MSLGAADRATLRAVVESSDARVSPTDRLRALELLHEAGGGDDTPAGAELIRWVSNLPDDALDAELEGYLGAEVEHRVTAELARLAEHRAREAAELAT